VTESGSADGWARRRARIASEIERAALELFATRSPDDVTVEEIAHAAGVSRRTFFRYFPSRDDVLTALPMRHIERLCARFEARPANEGVLQAYIAAVIEEEAAGVQDELILHWGHVMLPAMPVQDRIANAMVDAYGASIAARTGLDPSEPRVQVWAAAIASTSSFAFMRWLDSGGSRSLILAESMAMLGELHAAGGRDPNAEISSRRRAPPRKVAIKNKTVKKPARR
jgi:AcrR family transcriptional regulator